MKLQPKLKSLCSKVALERTRPVQWKTAADLRRDAGRILELGKSPEEVEAWLQSLLVDALGAQATPSGDQMSTGTRWAKPRLFSFRQ